MRPGDFFYVPSGTIHALCSGVLILETQQSSDTTYRVYDYDRRDQEGNTRELHISKSIDVSTIPHVNANVEPKVVQLDGTTVTTFVNTNFFTVYKWEVTNALEETQDHPFLIGSVIKGAGQLTNETGKYTLKKGDHFILPNGFGDFTIQGNVTLIVSHT